MTPDTENLVLIVRKTVDQFGGAVLELKEQGYEFEIVFTVNEHRFHLRERGGRDAEGSGLFHIVKGKEKDVYQELYGFQGDKSDVDAAIEYIATRPGNGLTEWRRFFPQLLREYVESL